MQKGRIWDGIWMLVGLWILWDGRAKKKFLELFYSHRRARSPIRPDRVGRRAVAATEEEGAASYLLGLGPGHGPACDQVADELDVAQRRRVSRLEAQSMPSDGEEVKGRLAAA